jgi:hypothetical protein
MSQSVIHDGGGVSRPTIQAANETTTTIAIESA